MKQAIFYLSVLGCLAGLASCNSSASPTGSDSAKRWESDWTSLRHHQTPPWLVEAKFGIYCHWGIQTLSYEPGREDLDNDSLIALFKGEAFNAEEWADLFVTAGAKFGGVIGWHGSDFKHWDSDLSDYNSAKLGPKIDIVGEVAQAVKKRGLKFLVSYHSVKNDDWIEFAKEGVDKYDPDIFWLDASFGGTKGGQHRKALDRSKYIGQQDSLISVFPEKYQRDFISYFYQKAEVTGKEVELMYKSYDIPPGVGMRDYENGILDQLAYDVWITDMDMSIPPDWATHGWFFRAGVPLRTANELLDLLVDVVSKNGLFLLNIPPKADGSFPEEVVQTLSELGAWLQTSGEAIYGTSPWFIYGEGPSEVPAGSYTFHHNNHFNQLSYNEKDIRFTVKGDYLYATCLGQPKDDLTIEALNSGFKLREGDILEVTHLGSGQQVNWQHDQSGLHLELASLPLDGKANSFRIKLKF